MGYFWTSSSVAGNVFVMCTNVVVALRAARNSQVHSNGAINYAIAVHLFRTVLRDRLKN